MQNIQGKTFFIQEGEMPILWTVEEITRYVHARIVRIKEIQAQQVALQVKIDAYKTEILPMLVATGINEWMDPAGTAAITMPREVVTYDTKALDTLVSADRYKYGYLSRFRGMNVVDGGIEVK